MSKLIFVVPALVAVGCVAQRSEVIPAEANAAPVGLVAQLASAPTPTPVPTSTPAAAAAAAVDSEAVATDVKTVAIEELDNGLVCEARERSGSRVTRKVCYTREEYAAVQALQREQAQQYARDLSREREMREAQERADQERRRSVAGL